MAKRVLTIKQLAAKYQWRESGGPPVTAPERRGFGSAVIGTLAETNLGAKADLSFASAGLSWRLECVAGEILDAA